MSVFGDYWRKGDIIMGIASLIIGIVALVLSFFGIITFWPALILGIGGIVLGALGKKKSGAGTAGMIISIIAVAICLIWFIACGGCALLA